jgi:hypothetical protein
MPDSTEKPPARPVFRKIAYVVAVACLLLAVVFCIVPTTEQKSFTVGVCLFVGLVMATIGATGHWPPK